MATDTEKLNTLYASLRAYLNNKRPPEKLFIVHRLDREASGLLVFAKTLELKLRPEADQLGALQLRDLFALGK